MSGGRALPADRLERVTSWGGATSRLAYVYRPSTVDEVHDVFAVARDHGCTVGLRGAGQSYGDAATNAEQIVLDSSRMTRILEWDPTSGLVRAEPGVTIGRLWRHAIGDGWWPPVVPGTMAVSLGGAAGMNIHGKNNWKVGPIGEHVEAIDLLFPSGVLRRVTREGDRELFHAAIGGFGMLGFISSVTLRLKKVHSGLVAVEPIAVESLAEMVAVFEQRLTHADYLVGWVDGFATGPALGRGLVHAARYLAPGEDPEPARTLRVAAQELPGMTAGVVPKSVAWRAMWPFMNDPGMRLVNAAKYWLGRREDGRHYRQSHAGFAFLLDYVPDWKRAYGAGGLIQYQSFVPAEAAVPTFAELLSTARAQGFVPYLGVFKRHRADAFLVTHAVDGYSLALDFKVTATNRERLWRLAGTLDRIVLSAGGRFYLAKDSTLTAEHFQAFVGEARLAKLRALKAHCDPEGLLATDLARRLGVVRPSE